MIARDEYADTITIARSGHVFRELTVTGPRQWAMRHFRLNGTTLWARADGRAVLFYRDPVTKRPRRKTWRRIHFIA